MNSMNGFMQNVDQTTQLQGSGSPKVPAGPWNRASLATNQTELRNQSQNNSGFAQTPPDIPKTSSQQETLNVLNGINSNYVTSPNMTNPGGLLSPKNNTNFSVESPLSSPTLNQSNARPSVYQPLTISNPSNSLLSPGLLSPNLLSPHQGLSSPSTPRTPGSLNGYKLPKISCLLDPKDVPAPPPPPEPPLSVDRLSPPTPSITVRFLRFHFK